VLKYVQVFVNNKRCAGLNENKEVSFSKNSWTFELCLSVQVCKKGKFMLCVPKTQIALVLIQQQIKFNVGPCGTYESEIDFAPKHFNLVPSFPGCSTFNFSLIILFGSWVFVLFFFFVLASVVLLGLPAYVFSYLPFLAYRLLQCLTRF